MMGENKPIKLSVIQRNLSHAGILASIDTKVLAYSSFYTGWDEDTGNMTLFGIPKSQDLSPWFREKMPRKIGLGYFVGRVDEQMDISPDHYDAFIKNVFVPEKNRVLRDANIACQSLLQESQDPVFKSYIEALVSSLSDKNLINGNTKRISPPVDRDSVLDLFCRSLKIGGRMYAVNFAAEILGRLSEHELSKRGESPTYNNFELLREKIAAWVYAPGTEEQEKLGLMVMYDTISGKKIDNLNS